MSFLRTLRDRFADAVAAVTDKSVDDPTVAQMASLVKPASASKGGPSFGDYQANMAMPLAKSLGRNPQVVAQQIIDAVDVDDLCEPPSIAGPGFINLVLKDELLARRAASLLDESSQDPSTLGIEPTRHPRTIIVDFSSPNVAKPMHVGHLRSTVIGDALQRLLRRLGHNVTSDNHIGDWGTQFGMILWGYKHLLDDNAYRSQPVVELARLYRTVNDLIAYQTAVANLPALEAAIEPARDAVDKLKAEAEPADKKLAKAHRKAVARAEAEAKAAAGRAADANSMVVNLPSELKAIADAHPDIATAARQETARLHRGDEENLRLWNEFLPYCLQALDTMYHRLGVSFDQTKGESYYQPRLPQTVQRLLDEGLAEESNGAVVVFPKDAGPDDAPLIVRKTDGAYTYGTTDLATIEHRVDDEHADQILYVVDARQSEHFDRVFETAARMGERYADVAYHHVSFGTVMGDDRRPFKTRSGTNIGLDSLIDEAIEKARAVVDANEDAKPDGVDRLSDLQRQQVAELVGVGAVKYADLKHNRESDYVFDWDKMLATNGDTATYMQYAYARTRSILRKSGETISSGPIDLGEPAERALALKLLQYPDAVEAVGQELRPHLLTAYLFELAGLFSTFFDQCPVLKADDAATRTSRLRLVDLTGRVIKDGLALLGIETAEQM